MSIIPGQVISRVLEEVRCGKVIDIYAIAIELQLQLPQLSHEDLANHVAEVVAVTNGCAVWDRRH
jgi:hypothetical protein